MGLILRLSLIRATTTVTATVTVNIGPTPAAIKIRILRKTATRMSEIAKFPQTAAPRPYRRITCIGRCNIPRQLRLVVAKEQREVEGEGRKRGRVGTHRRRGRESMCDMSPTLVLWKRRAGAAAAAAAATVAGDRTRCPPQRLVHWIPCTATQG